MIEKQITSRQLIWEGFLAIVPLMFGVAPFGVVYGALATGAGLSMEEALGMSIFVLAGSSQFVAVSLIDNHTPALLIIFTTFIINLRHFLYSASLTNFLRPLSQPARAIIAYFMIDEVYAATIRRYRTGEFSPSQFRWYFIGAGFNLVLVWWGTTILGVWLGNVINETTMDLLAFTLPLIFTSIVVPMLISSPKFWSAIAAVGAAILFAPLPNNLNLIVAATVGIGVGVLFEGRQTPSTTTGENL